MIRTIFATSIATLAIVAAAPATAAPGGGHAGGGGTGGGVGANAGGGPMGGMNAGGPIGGMNAGGLGGGLGGGAGIHGNAGLNGQGSINASPRGVERANTNSAIRRNSTSEPMTGTRLRTSSGANINANANAGIRANGGISARTNLTGVTNGMTVVDSSGATVGTVTGVRTIGNGTAKSVQVTLTSGQVVNVDARSLNLSGGNLATTNVTGNVRSQGAAHASINGLVHASPRSALGSAGITTLTGLATGLTVNNSGGTSVGTVSGILTNRAGAVVGVQVALTGGGTVTVPATTLSMNGTTVVTTSTAVH